MMNKKQQVLTTSKRPEKTTRLSKRNMNNALRHTKIVIISLLIAMNSYGAVTSVGEINVEGEAQGVVPASSIVPLIVTLSVDRSLAEPGEEIKTIEIELPPGFLTRSADFRGITRDGSRLAARAVVSATQLRIELADVIIDLQNSVYDIRFDCRTPNIVMREATFRARLRNLQDGPIGEFIRAGQADGRLNNDDFTLQVIPNVPPAPVTGFTAEADATGENDVTLRWQKSADPDVNGYLIYRDGNREPPINVENASSTTYRDVNVLPGSHTYEIASYKTLQLRSERSAMQTVNVSEDTAAPAPPATFDIVALSEGIELTWTPSASRDVVRYQIAFGSSSTSLSPLTRRDVEASANTYKFLDERPLEVGSFVYTIVAIDEAENASEPRQEILRILDEPYPNPFTPLSPNADFNRVIFPARVLEEAVASGALQGEFRVLIFNIEGMLVKTLTAPLGETELIWDGTDETGEIVESGVYVYQLQIGESFKTGTIIVAK